MAFVQRPALEGIAVSGRHCKCRLGVVFSGDRACAGVDAAVGVDRQLAAVDLPLCRQRHVAVVAGQCGACVHRVVLGPAACGVARHFPVQEGVAGLFCRGKCVGAFNVVAQVCDLVAAVGVELHSVAVRRPLCRQRCAAEFTDRCRANVCRDFFIGRPVACRDCHEPAREGITGTGHRRKRCRSYDVIADRGLRGLVAVLAAAVVQRQRVRDRFIGRRQRVGRAFQRTEGVLLRFRVERAVFVAAERPGLEAVAVSRDRVGDVHGRAGALRIGRRKCIVGKRAVITCAEFQRAGVLRPVRVQFGVCVNALVKVIHIRAVCRDILRAEAACFREVTLEGPAGSLRRCDLVHRAAVRRVCKVRAGIEGIIDLVGVLRCCALSVKNHSDVVCRPVCIQVRRNGDCRIRAVDDRAVSANVLRASAVLFGEVAAEGVAVLCRSSDRCDLVGLIRVIEVMAISIGVIHRCGACRRRVLIVECQRDDVRRSRRSQRHCARRHRECGILCCRIVKHVIAGPGCPGVAGLYRSADGHACAELVSACATDTADAGAVSQRHIKADSVVVVVDDRRAVRSHLFCLYARRSEAFIDLHSRRDIAVCLRLQRIFGFIQRVLVVFDVLLIVVDDIVHIVRFPLRIQDTIFFGDEGRAFHFVGKGVLRVPAEERITGPARLRACHIHAAPRPLCEQDDGRVADEGHALLIGVDHLAVCAQRPACEGIRRGFRCNRSAAFCIKGHSVGSAVLVFVQCLLRTAGEGLRVHLARGLAVAVKAHVDLFRDPLRMQRDACFRLIGIAVDLVRLVGVGVPAVEGVADLFRCRQHHCRVFHRPARIEVERSRTRKIHRCAVRISLLAVFRQRPAVEGVGHGLVRFVVAASCAVVIIRHGICLFKGVRRQHTVHVRREGLRFHRTVRCAVAEEIHDIGAGRCGRSQCHIAVAHREARGLFRKRLVAGPAAPGEAVADRCAERHRRAELVGTGAGHFTDAAVFCQRHCVRVSRVEIFHNRAAVRFDRHFLCCRCGEAFKGLCCRRLAGASQCGQRFAQFGCFGIIVVFKVLQEVLDGILCIRLCPLRIKGGGRLRCEGVADRRCLRIFIRAPSGEGVALAGRLRVGQIHRSLCPLRRQRDIIVAGKRHILTIGVGRAVAAPVIEDISRRLAFDRSAALGIEGNGVFSDKAVGIQVLRLIGGKALRCGAAACCAASGKDHVKALRFPFCVKRDRRDRAVRCKCIAIDLIRLCGVGVPALEFIAGLARVRKVHGSIRGRRPDREQRKIVFVRTGQRHGLLVIIDLRAAGSFGPAAEGICHGIARRRIAACCAVEVIGDDIFLFEGVFVEVLCHAGTERLIVYRAACCAVAVKRHLERARRCVCCPDNVRGAHGEVGCLGGRCAIARPLLERVAALCRGVHGHGSFVLVGACAAHRIHTCVAHVQRHGVAVSRVLIFHNRAAVRSDRHCCQRSRRSKAGVILHGRCL